MEIVKAIFIGLGSLSILLSVFFILNGIVIHANHRDKSSTRDLLFAMVFPLIVLFPNYADKNLQERAKKNRKNYLLSIALGFLLGGFGKLIGATL